MQSLQWYLSLSLSLFVSFLWNFPPAHCAHLQHLPSLSLRLCESLLWGNSFGIGELVESQQSDGCVCVSVCLRVKGVTAADYIPANNHGETTAGSVLLRWRDWLWIDSVRLRESQTAKREDEEGESSVVYLAASLLIRLCQGKDDKTYRGGTDVSVAKLVYYEVKLINIQSLFYDLHPKTAHFPVQRGKRRRHRWSTKTAHPLMSSWGWLQKCVPPPETPMLK